MPTTRDSVFSRVQVDYAVRGVARVTWALRSSFRDFLPHIFTVQMSYNGGGPNAEWCNVGIPFENSQAYLCDTVPTNQDAYDDTQRVFGKKFDIVYRIHLTTPQGEYYSQASTILGNLSKRQWLLLRGMQRRIALHARTLDSYQGFLLKRKSHGTRCTACVDLATGGVTNSDCEECQGTGIVDGYWQAAQDTMYDMSPELVYTQRDNSLQRGTVNDVVVTGMFIGCPGIASRDVWVEAASDRRYYVHRVKHLAELNSVPVNVEAELRLAAGDDIIYTVPIGST